MGRKKRANAAASAASIKAALTALRNKEYKTVYAAAKALNVSETTLRAQWKQTRLTRAEANEAKQILSGAEEEALRRYIKQLSRSGYPPSYVTVREMAAEIQQRRVAKLNFEEGMELVQYPPIGADWPRRFITVDDLRDTLTKCGGRKKRSKRTNLPGRNGKPPPPTDQLPDPFAALDSLSNSELE
jgi:hypothetical protein